MFGKVLAEDASELILLQFRILELGSQTHPKTPICPTLVLMITFSLS